MRTKEQFLLEQTYQKILEKTYLTEMMSYVKDPSGVSVWEFLRQDKDYELVQRKTFPRSQYNKATELSQTFEFGGVVRDNPRGYEVWELVIAKDEVREYTRKRLAGQPVEALVRSTVKIKPLKALKAESSQILYDFGGSESVYTEVNDQSITDIVVVDKIAPDPEDLNAEELNGKNLYFTKADLFKPITLPKPAQWINVSKLFRYGMSPEKTNVLVDNIDRYLLKNGYLRVFEDSDESNDRDPFMLKLIELFRSKGYTLMKTEGYNAGKYEMALFRK